MHGSLEIRKVSLDDQVPALALVFADLALDERERHIDELLANWPHGPLDSLWVAYVDGRLVAAILAQVEPGHTALVKVPGAADDDLSIRVALLEAVVAELDRGGVRLARALAKTNSGPDAQVLEGAGFRPLCELVYLVGLRANFPTDPPGDGLSFAPYGGDLRRLAAIIERTYVGSLDCPALESARAIDDVLAGYRATGGFDPARWLIVSREGVDVGCLLMTDWPKNDQWELIYMGIVPEARGCGYGGAIVRQAQWLTRQAGRERLVLGVDAANVPANDIYAAAGLIAWDKRCVYVRTS